MNKEVVFNLIQTNKENLIKIGEAVKVDFHDILKQYVVTDRMLLERALLKVSDDIVEEYKDKIEVWNSIQENLENTQCK